MPISDRQASDIFDLDSAEVSAAVADRFTRYEDGQLGAVCSQTDRVFAAIHQVGDFRRTKLPGRNNVLLSRDEPPSQLSIQIDDPERDHSNWIVLLAGGRVDSHIFTRGSRNLAIIHPPTAGIHPFHVHFHTNEHLLFLDRQFTSNTTFFEMSGDGTSILVGEDCMFSAEINFMTSDDHAIYDLTTRQHLNQSKSIIVEPHVWIGMGAKILKGARIGSGAVVGAGSIVTRSVPRNVVVAGNPARIIRTEIGWTRDRLPPG